jgi:hypothetical protein
MKTTFIIRRVFSVSMLAIFTFPFLLGSDGVCIRNLPAGEIDESEISSLQWMREEEMLAHDVYEYLAGLYSVPVFRNISKSEMRHTTAIAELLNKYNIEDPAAEHVSGSFTDPSLQELYDRLVNLGQQSYKDALRVGLMIEDLDIADLEHAIQAEVDNEDIEFVYGNLLNGSRRHLKAFWFHASKNSVDYSPEHISLEDFEEIVSGE